MYIERNNICLMAYHSQLCIAVNLSMFKMRKNKGQSNFTFLVVLPNGRTISQMIYITRTDRNPTQESDYM